MLMRLLMRELIRVLMIALLMNMLLVVHGVVILVPFMLAPFNLRLLLVLLEERLVAEVPALAFPLESLLLVGALLLTLVDALLDLGV